jgi:uncharacterized protein
MRALPGGIPRTAATAVLLLSACAQGRGTSASAPPASAPPVAASTAGAAALAPVAPVALTPAPVFAGTYWPDRSCTFLVDSGRPVWNWCIESVTVAPGGDLVFRSRWEFSAFAGGPIEKGPDAGNPKMYVADSKARRLDHVSTTEAARLGGVLSRDKPVLRGDFVFRPAAFDPPFTFHDADNNVAIEGIRLDASRKGDTEGRGNARLRARLTQLRKADEVVVEQSWGGLGQPWAKRSVLRRAGPGPSGAGTVPVATMDAFLERLASAPLVEGPYFPRHEHTDDFPRAAIRFGSADDALVVFSESQGAERIPWALQFEGRRYVIPSDAPARALDIVQAQIAEAEVKVARGVEPPASAPSGPAWTLASALIRAASRGDAAEVRRLLAAGADPGRGDDENGHSAVHAAASMGHAEILTLFADSGAALDVPDFRGLTPLMLAASGGRAAAAKLLVERGARSQLAEALGAAASAGHVEVVRALLQAGAPANARSGFGLTALMAAVGVLSGPHPDVMSALLDSGADVNAVDMAGRTALRHLVDPPARRPARGAGEVVATVRLLRARGADPSIKDKQGRSVLDVLASRPGTPSDEILAALGGVR